MKPNEPINSLDDVFYYTAKKHGKTPEQIKLIYDNLFKTVSYYLSRPHLCGIGLNIKNFIKFRLREKAILSYYNKLKILKEKFETKEMDEHKTIRPSKYNKMLTNLQYYENLMEMIETNKKTEKKHNG